MRKKFVGREGEVYQLYVWECFSYRGIVEYYKQRGENISTKVVFRIIHELTEERKNRHLMTDKVSKIISLSKTSHPIISKLLTKM